MNSAASTTETASQRGPAVCLTLGPRDSLATGPKQPVSLPNNETVSQSDHETAPQRGPAACLATQQRDCLTIGPRDSLATGPKQPVSLPNNETIESPSHTPHNAEKQSQELARYVQVVLEQSRHDMKLFAEGIKGNRARLDNLEPRVDRLESAS